MKKPNAGKLLTVSLVLLTLASGCDSLTDTLNLGTASPGLFDVEFPKGANWRKAADGPVSGASNSYAIVYVDEERSAQCGVLVLPSLAGFETLDLMKDRWEVGFSEKFTRKLPSQSMTINGHNAHVAIGEIDSEAGPYQLAGILVVHPPHNYTLSVPKLNSNVLSDPELKQFINSFRIRN